MDYDMARLLAVTITLHSIGTTPHTIHLEALGIMDLLRTTDSAASTERLFLTNVWQPLRTVLSCPAYPSWLIAAWTYSNRT